MIDIDIARLNSYRAIDVGGDWKHGNDYEITPDGMNIIDDSYKYDDLIYTPVRAHTLCRGYRKQDARGRYIFERDFAETPMGFGMVCFDGDAWAIKVGADRFPLDDCHNSITVVGNRFDNIELLARFLESLPETDQDL